MKCAGPISFETLLAYWLGEVPAERAAPIEEHLFGCADCARRADELVALASSVRTAVRSGTVGLVVSEGFVEAMKLAGLRLREYRLGPGGSVNCTIAADDDAVISRLRAPLADVTRLDVVNTPDDGEPEQRLADVPFDAARGEVLVIPAAAWLKAKPAFTMRMRLVSVGEAGERQVGDYTFKHSPS